MRIVIICLSAAILQYSSSSTSAETKALDPDKQFQEYRIKLKSSKSFYDSENKKCAAGILGQNQENKQKLAIILNVQTNKVADLYCKRVADAWISGKFTLEMLKKLNDPSPEFIRVIQGR